MRHPGSPRFEYLANQSAPWLLIVGLVALVVGVVFIIGAALPGHGSFTAQVSASARHLADKTVLDRGSAKDEHDPGFTMGLSDDVAPTSDNDGGISADLPGTRGALHAGDRSPFAVSSRIDLRLDFMEATARGHRRDPAADRATPVLPLQTGGAWRHSRRP